MTTPKSSRGRDRVSMGNSSSIGFVNGNGLTNGLGMTNGKGRTNGLVNGLGRVNGVGRTNGLTNGFVNGSGLVNGIRRPLKSNPFGIVTNRDVRIGVSLAILFILLLPSFYLLMSVPPPRSPVIKIDGIFSDWTGVPKYTDDWGGSNDDISFAEYALAEDAEALFGYFRVRGQLFPVAQNYDCFYAFIDEDGNSATGYWPGELGAEYAVSIHGASQKATSAGLLKFESTADRFNWTAWKSASTASYASSYDSIEFAVSTHMMELSDDYVVRLVGDDFEGHTTLASYRIGKEPGSLRVEQVPRTSLTALTPSSNWILHLKLSAQGGAVVISDFAASTHWQYYPSDLASRLQMPNRVEIAEGDQVQVDIGLDLNGLGPMSPIWLNLTGLDADVPVTILGDGGVGYVNQLPQHKVVDGWFGDWQSGLETDTNPPIDNDNVDIDAYSSNITRVVGYEKALFYVDFRGRAMGGDSVPAQVIWLPPSQPSPPGTPQPLPRVAGEDMLIIYIDANSTDSRGCRAGSLSADYRLDFKGWQGKVRSKTVHECVGGLWIQMVGVVPEALSSGSSMEISVDLDVLGTIDDPEILMQSTDWRNKGDIPPPIGLGTKSGERGGTRSGDIPLILSDPPGLEEVTSLPLSNNPFLDGHCDDSQYSDAGHVTRTNFEFYVGHRLNRVWICIIFYDTSNDALDYAELIFDTMHNDTNFPQIDDRHFRLAANSNSLLRERGNGADWIACDSECGANDLAQSAFYNNFQNYEFRLNQLNVWNINNVEGRAGFAIHLFNVTGSTDYYWGSSNVNINNPSTWGHIYIPEFPAILLPMLIALAVVYTGRKRRRA